MGSSEFIKKLLATSTSKILVTLLLVSALVLALININRSQLLKSDAGIDSATLSGDLSVVLEEDFDNNIFKTNYYLQTEINGQPQTIKINYTGTKDLVPGKIELRGAVDDNGELVASDSSIVLLQPLSQTAADQEVLNQRTVQIILLNWANHPIPGVTPANTTAAEAAFDPVETFYSTDSYDQEILINEVVDVIGSGSGGWINSTINYDCTALSNFTQFTNPIDAYLSTLSLPNANRRIVVMPDCDNYAITNLSVTGIRIRMGHTKFMRPSVVIHELGHTLGYSQNVKHTGDLSCTNNQVGTSTCSVIRDYGLYEPMGVGLSGTTMPNTFGAYHKELFRWIDSSRITYLNNDANNVSIRPASSATGVIEARICRDANTFYSIENKINAGYDAGNLPPAAYTGAIIRLVGITDGAFPNNYGHPIDLYNMGPAAFGQGATFTDSTANIAITVNGKTNNVLSVSVNYTGTPPANCPFAVTAPTPTPVPTPPNPTTPPTPPPTTPPNSAAFKVTIDNRAPTSHSVLKNGVVAPSYASVNAGPAKINVTTIGKKVLASERYLYSVNGSNTSFTETMALPSSKLSTRYWLPVYTTSANTDSQIRVGNASGAPATVNIYISGTKTADSPFTVPVGGSVKKTYPNINKGPVKIESNTNVVVSQRIIYKPGGVATSYAEMMALPGTMSAASYVNYTLPFYTNNANLDTQLRIANIGNSEAIVDVYVGGTKVENQLHIPVNTAARKNYANLNTGPVKIVSTNNVAIAPSARQIYKVNNVGVSYMEFMAMPTSELSTKYTIPYYQNSATGAVTSQIIITNPNATGTATVSIFKGDTLLQGNILIPAGGNVKKSFATAGGPIRIESNSNVIASNRITYKNSGAITSFSEMLAAPTLSAATEMWFPWYSSTEVSTQFRVAYP